MGSPRRRSLSAAVLAAVLLCLAACSGSGHKPAAAPSPSLTSDSPSPTPTATAAADTCPLTGLSPSAQQDAHRPALAVKIDNINAARPQVGVDKADIVVEELVEGGLTRLFAIYQCDSADRIEPIRSARTSDADLLSLLHGSVFAFSGSNPGALPPIRVHGNAVLISYDVYGQYFHRDSARPAPHNVYSSSAVLLAAGQQRRSGLGAPPSLFAYDDAAPSAGTAARTVSVKWPQQSAAWTWSRGTWIRTQNGTPDVLANGRRVNAANVVIMSIVLGSTGLKDVAGNASPLDITTGGPRPVWVLRDGKVISGTWIRTSITASWRLVDSTGAPIPLKPGRTWIELLPRPAAPVVR